MDERIQSKSARTRGDGMENETLLGESLSPSSSSQLPKVALSRSSASESGESSNYKSVNTDSVTLPAVIPTGRVFHLIPRLVTAGKSPLTAKHREPRFVPFEPYKGAVNPMVPLRKQKIKVNRNNLDLNVLVSQMATLTASEFGVSTFTNKSEAEVDPERQKYEHRLSELQKQRNFFEAQLKFQVQVNSELKKLLVAAVGEDLQTRVNVLTEDKLQLARALLDSANNLSSHTEQIEYLAGQSEVWRSKFLSSSLMVEELARWKASLIQKNDELITANKQMLDQSSQVRDMSINTLKNLAFVMQVKELRLPTSNVLNLNAECLNISQQLVLHAGVGTPFEQLPLAGLDPLTEAEKFAIEALRSSTQTLLAIDDPFKAIVRQAFPAISALQQNHDDGKESKQGNTHKIES